jgi:hypothetical protein
VRAVSLNPSPSSTLRFVVLAGLGQARILVDPPEAELIDSYNALVEA